MASKFINISFELNEFFAKIVAHLFQNGRINFNPGQFHFRDDRNKRAFDIFIYAEHFFAREAGLENFVQAQRDFSVLCGIVQRFFNRYLVERDLVFAFACDIFEGNCLMSQEPFGEGVHAVRKRGSIQNIGDQHRIIKRFDADVVFCKHLPVIFHVMSDFKNAVIFQHWLKQRERLCKRHLLCDFIGALAKKISALCVCQRNIGSLADFTGQ